MRTSMEVSVLSAKRSKRNTRNSKNISPYILSAAEADVSQDATGTAGHLESTSAPTTSSKKPVSSKNSTQPARRKDNCTACAHLIVRAGQPFQCRIFSTEYAEYNLERRDRINLEEGYTCPFFMRITSRQIDEILKSHGSSLSSEQVREYAHQVDEQTVHTKTVVFSPHAGVSAEELLREELLRYLMDGYTVIEATVTREENQSESKHSTNTTHKIRLRVKQDD